MLLNNFLICHVYVIPIYIVCVREQVLLWLKKINLLGATIHLRNSSFVRIEEKIICNATFVFVNIIGGPEGPMQRANARWPQKSNYPSQSCLLFGASFLGCGFTWVRKQQYFVQCPIAKERKYTFTCSNKALYWPNNFYIGNSREAPEEAEVNLKAQWS